MLIIGFLSNAINKHYRPSPRRRILMAGILHGSHFYIVQHHILEKVATEVNAAVHYVVLSKNGMRLFRWH